MKKVLIFFYLFITALNAQQKWQTVGEMYRPVYGAQAVVIDTAIYIIGGFDNKLSGQGENEYSDSIRVYYPNSGKWGTAIKMVEPRYGLVAVNYNDSLVYFGGTRSQSQNPNSLEVWNGKSVPYIYKSNQNFNRSFSAGAAAGNFIYLFGGNSVLSNSDYMVKYNLLTGTVANSNNYSLTFHPQSNQMAAADSGNIYLFGGLNALGTLSKSIFKFVLSSGAFSKLNSDLNKPIINASAVSFGNDKIYIIGGRDESDPLSDVKIFNYKTQQISNGPSLNKARTELTAAKFRNSIYVFGGQDKNNNTVDEIEKLDIVTSVNGPEPQAIKNFRLYNNFPNPFNPSTMIRYSVPAQSFVTLKVYNLLGEEIAVLVHSEKPAGEYQVTFNTAADGRQLQSGVYFYRIQVYTPEQGDNFVQTKNDSSQMTKKNLLYIVLSFLVIPSLFAQEKISPIDSLKAKFEAFNYPEVISTADSLLKFNINLSSSQLIEIYRMKAVSEFSLLEDEAAKKSFISILQINKNYQLDSARTSPKIIAFFNEVKAKYLSDLNKQEELNIAADSLYASRLQKQRERIESNFRNSIVRSLILPGLGHLYLGKKTKGLLLTSLSSVSLGSMIYFIIDSNSKEKDYLNSSNPAAMLDNYNSYNNSYRLRNVSIITFAVLWLYSQVDLLLFNNFSAEQNQTSQNLPQLKYDSFRGIQLGYNFCF